MKKNLAVFISGHGSNLNIFLQNKEKFNKIIVISSNSEAYGLQRAKEYGVESFILDKTIDWDQLKQDMKSASIDLIFLAGFMKIVPESFIQSWKGKLFNIHPSMLPKYKGLNAIRRAYQAKDGVGVTIHHVTSEVDAGEWFEQRLAVSKDEVCKSSFEGVKKRTHECEHVLVKNWIDEFS